MNTDFDFTKDKDKYIESLQDEIRKLRGEDKTEQFLNLMVKVGKKEYNVNTKISVPKLMNYYYINIDGKQVKVQLINYKAIMGAGKIWVFATVTANDKPPYKLFQVEVNDLFKSEGKAYDYYIKHYEDVNHGNTYTYNL